MILRVLWQSAALLLLAAAGAWAVWRWHPQAPALYLAGEPVGPDEVSIAEALALEKSPGVIWLDARTRREFDKAHVPGAFLLNVYEWEDLVTPVAERLGTDGHQRAIIIYCDSRKCTAARELLQRIREVGLGDFDIRVLHGGWPAWRQAQQ